ncbi:LysM peptidoglycan-binding domain-containing protein [Paenibacillus sp. MMS18-CY102]|nr:LysM peptidoglycan-binding domain-containing protein [Paenibacillus sp. MMS18-CY102]
MKKWARTAVAAIAGITIAWSAASADAATTHIASKTTTFWTLSQYYSLTVQQIANANPKVDANNIAVGSRLAIPTPDTAKDNTAAMKMASANDQQLIAGGKAYDVAKTVQATATAYTAAASENGKWGALDYFGNSLKVGTVAVDPNHIALGTKLYIVGYDYDGLPVGGMLASASDMGSSIKGNRIDIFVPGTTVQAKSFGMQYVKVYVLKS